MDHLAIMKKSWGLTGKILSGRKTVESRWHKTKSAPWDRVKPGDVVYFKDSGCPVCLRAYVSHVKQFPSLTPEKVRHILDEYGEVDGITRENIPKFFGMFKDKKYCTIVFLKKAEAIEPFDVDKSGFGSMSSWLVLESIGKIRKSPG